MSHFYGKIEGSAKHAVTRRGNKSSGLATYAASWAGAIRVCLYEEGGQDYFIVEQVKWKGQGVREVLVRGVVGVPSNLDDEGRVLSGPRDGFEPVSNPIEGDET